MKTQIRNNANLIAWGLGLLVAALAVISWGNNLSWSFSGSLVYSVFPLLGLLAFSWMWTHYVMYAMRIYSGYEKSELDSYNKITGYGVLVAILLHPGLLIMQLYADGFGLPPESYKEYVGEAAAGFVLLGTISLLAFLAYEFKEKNHNKSWWKFVSLANAVAMLLIFIHAINLGGNVASGWYGTVWAFYGLSLLAIYAYLFVKNKLI